MLLSTLSIVPLFSASVFARAHGILKRQSGQNGQDGPVDAGTAADCTYYDTALNNNYNCAYFENEWGVSHEDFVSYVSPCYNSFLHGPMTYTLHRTQQ